MDSKESCKSWFCVLNNPQDIYTGEPHEIAHKCLDDWIDNRPTRAGAVAYCITAEGLIHLHMVLEDSQKARFSALKKTYPKAHLEPTKGTKEQAEDYINKRGKYQEKGEQVIYIARHGEIKGNQGARKDFEVIELMIEEGKTPREIMMSNFSYRRYDKMIKQAYFDKRNKETPYFRDIKVYWHVGETGTGKSHVSRIMIDEHGENHLYMYTDFLSGGLDNYCGEPVLFMDEFRGDLKYGELLKILQGYKMPLHARYTNIIPLWTEVHITSPLPPERVYMKMAEDNRDLDTQKQLFRRISFVVYHWKEENNYCQAEIPMSEYTSYEDMKRKCQAVPEWVRQAEESEQEELPF
jgi:hypothetical protein